MYRYECIYRIHVCVNVCVCVCARGGVVCPFVQRASASTLVHRGVYGCPDAHAHTHIGGSMCVCLQPYPRACAYGWMYMRACIDGSASTGVHRYACICVYIERYLYHYYASMMHVYACIMYGRSAALCTQVSMSVCTQPDRYRWVHVYLAPSDQRNI
jgi:hypothetical protein